MYELIAFCKWCQHLPLPELAKYLKDIGFDGVDLPCRPGAPVTHANGPEKLPEVKRILEDHGLKLSRVVTQLTEVTPETERLLETIRDCGITRIRIGGYALEGNGPCAGRPAREALDMARRRFAALGMLLAKYQVKGGVQNHSGNTLDVNVSSCLLMIQDADPRWVGVQYDPGHCTISGEPISVAIGLLGDRLQSVNLKSPRQEHYSDPTSGRWTWGPIWTPLRDGMLDLPLLLKTLRKTDYAEPLSLHAEYRTHYHLIEHNLEATARIMKEDVAYVREVMANVEA